MLLAECLFGPFATEPVDEATTPKQKRREQDTYAQLKVHR